MFRRANFDAMVKAYVVDAAGNKTEKPAEEVFDMMKTNKDLRADYERKTLILFEATDGRVIIPLIGKGLWDDIWGYIALEKDMNTVSGIVMAHKSETPGLGAEIATPAHQALYKGKTLFEKGDFVSITLRKGGAKDPAHEVDARDRRYQNFGRRDSHAARQPERISSLLREGHGPPLRQPVRRSLTIKK